MWPALPRYAPGKTNFEHRLGPLHHFFWAIPPSRWTAIFGSQLFGADALFGRLRHSAKHHPRIARQSRSNSGTENA
jgi:hypothetical protein